MQPLPLAHKIVDAASEKLAADVVLLDIRKLTTFADYFVICSGDSPRQLNAIADEVEESLKKQQVVPHHREGSEASGWILLDYGDVVVHIFSEKQRAFYDLEAAWQAAPQLVHVQ